MKAWLKQLFCSHPNQQRNGRRYWCPDCRFVYIASKRVRMASRQRIPRVHCCCCSCEEAR